MAEVAADLGVDVQDLDFKNVGFYQGSEFPIEKEFDVGVQGDLALLSVSRGASTYIRARRCLAE